MTDEKATVMTPKNRKMILAAGQNGSQRLADPTGAHLI